MTRRLLPLLLLAAAGAQAGEVAVVGVELTAIGPTWEAAVTLRHADAGWDHYADAWRLVTAEGTVLATRTLFHPHVDEQPFTRSLGVTLPAGLRALYVEGHDKVHGWGPRLTVDLERDSGPGWTIRRQAGGVQ